MGSFTMRRVLGWLLATVAALAPLGAQAFEVQLKVDSKTFKDKGGAGSLGFGVTEVGGLKGATVEVTVTAESDGGWLLLESAPAPLTLNAKGAAKGKISYRVQRYLASAPTPRQGILRVGGAVFTVYQTGAPCRVTITPSKTAIGPDGTEGRIEVAAPDGCNWTANPDDTSGWLAIESGSSGAGGGTIRFLVPRIEAAKARTGKIKVTTVGAKPVTKVHAVKQSGRVAGKVAVSGAVQDYPATGGRVTVRGAAGTALATSGIDEAGGYAVQVSEAALGNGFEVVVEGGQVEGKPYAGSMRARYRPTESLAAANVTLLTTLVSALDATAQGATPLERRDAAVAQLVDIGMIGEGEWSQLAPPSVTLSALRAKVQSMGLDEWLSRTAADLADNDLSAANMDGFSRAHGGILAAQIPSSTGTLSVFRGQALSSPIQVLTLSEGAENKFSVVSGPPDLSVDAQGTVAFVVPSNAAANQEWPFEIRVTNPAMGRGRTVRGAIQALAGATLARKTVGAEGGALADSATGLVVTIPAGSLTQQAEFTVEAALDADGMVVLAFNGPEDPGPVEITLPPPDVLNLQLRGGTAGAGRASSRPAAGMTSARYAVADHLWLRDQWYFGGNTGWEGRIPRTTKIPALSFVRSRDNAWKGYVTEHTTFDLRSSYPIDAPELQYDGKEPVLFVHGYSLQWALGASLGGGDGTWADLPRLVGEIDGGRFVPFEFRWNTNARFQDVAEDFKRAVDLVYRKTGKNVHIVAHSFGGILVRTYLQGFATGYEKLNGYMHHVASLTTVGTPHSGIKDSGGNFVGSDAVDFPKGQDSLSFEGARQISVHQMGEPVTMNWDFFGIEEATGEMAVKLALGAWGVTPYVTYRLPEDLPIQVLIGLRAAEGAVEGSSAKKLTNGDGLITYGGQRFHPELKDHPGDLLTHSTRYRATVTEKLLGFPPDKKPGDSAVSLTGASFSGYAHSSLNRGMIEQSSPEVQVTCADAATCKHATFLELRDWLTGKQQTPGVSVLVDAPVFDPPAGAYEGPMVVTITAGTPGSTIRYTTNGMAPNPAYGLGLSGAGTVTLARSSELRAVAVSSDGIESPVASAIYTLRDVWYRDADGDGYSDGYAVRSVLRPVGYVAVSELEGQERDCDDHAVDVNPGKMEIFWNGVDDDCSEGGASASEASIWQLGAWWTGITSASSINESGSVAGTACNLYGQPRAWVWTPESGLADLGTLGGVSSYASAIGAGDVVVGQADDFWGATHAFVWAPGMEMLDLETLPGDNGSMALGIDDNGIALGTSLSSGGRNRAVLWDMPSGTTSSLGGLAGGDESWAVAISREGTIVGGSDDGSGWMHAVLWKYPNLLDVGTFGLDAATAIDVNSNDVVVGDALDTGLSDVQGMNWWVNSSISCVNLPDPSATWIRRAFRWQAGASELLPMAGGISSRASAINTAGIIVGSISFSNGASRAVLWREGHPIDLNDFVAPGSGWVLILATDVNDRGQIVGQGYLNGEKRAFLLSPIR